MNQSNKKTNIKENEDKEQKLNKDSKLDKEFLDSHLEALGSEYDILFKRMNEKRQKLNNK